MLDDLARNSVAGGRTYDAQILAVALKRNAAVLLNAQGEPRERASSDPSPASSATRIT